jgi:uncharacterized membrane protein
MLTPMLLDGFIQLLTEYTSNNIKRMVTGLLFGLAVPSLIGILWNGWFS